MRGRHSLIGVWAVSAILMTAVAFADTIVQTRIAATNRLLPLKKITVGPDDQYHGGVTPDGKIWFYAQGGISAPSASARFGQW